MIPGRALRVAIIGSRDFPQLWRVRQHVWQLHPNTIVVSGLARGVDSEARQAALKFGFNVIDVPANWDVHGKGAGFRRNSIIIELADEIVAFQVDGSRGTQDSIDKARKAGKPVTVIDVDYNMSMDPRSRS